MAYASASDLIARKDARTLGDLVSDDNLRAEQVDLATNTVLLAALDDASGEVDAALMQGKRYSAADLADLTGNSLAYLKRITCDIAFALLWNRRGYTGSDAQQAAIEDSRKALERLRKGENVFNLEAQKDAGLPAITGATRVQRQQLNLIAGKARGHFYPHETLPNNR